MTCIDYYSKHIYFAVIFSALATFCCIDAHLPEEHMSTPEIIHYYGYVSETHFVTTADGYILQLHRIVSRMYRGGRVFFLQHGLLASSFDWVANLPNQSAGFILSDVGFDVWMGNVRGNVYSNRHLNYSIDDYRFWTFSWDEMAKYDLESMINYVLNFTSQNYLYYVGHSQGTEIMFAKLSSDPKFGKKIKKFFALAPVSTVAHIKGLFNWLAELFGHKFWLIRLIFGHRDFPAHSWIYSLVTSKICSPKVSRLLCENVLFLISGPESSQLNDTRIPIYTAHIPAGTSTQNVIHWLQMRLSKKVQMYDFGNNEANLAHYGQTIPPLYDLSRVNAPVYLFHSDSDWLADSADVTESIINVVPKELLKFSKKLKHFNHLDFIWGHRARSEIYEDVIRYAKEYEISFRTKNMHQC